MARSQWGLWADELDDVQQAELVIGYIRRKRFEAELQAAQIWNVLGQALSKGKEPTMIDPEQMIARFGGFK